MYGYRYRYTIYPNIVYLDCHSPSNVIYIITCKRCSLQQISLA